jgi:hypothetical protein
MKNIDCQMSRKNLLLRSLTIRNYQPLRAKSLLLKLIHLFAREVLLVKKLEIEEIKAT